MDKLIPLLQNEEIFEVYINPDGKVWTDGYKGRQFSGLMMSAAQTKQIILNVAALTNQLVTDEKLLSVLSGIYLEHKDWIEVAKEIKYTVRYAMMLRDKGLSQITREK